MINKWVENDMALRGSVRKIKFPDASDEDGV